MSSPKKILLVDDEEDFCFFAKGHLEMSGNFQVRTVHNGTDALKEARAYQPDLILLDIVMPDMSGDEVAASLMEDPKTQQIRFVFLTALASQQQQDQSSPLQNIGGRYFIGKPISKDALLEALDTLME